MEIKTAGDMIQPNELRTGNLIKSVRDEELFVVTGIKNRVAKEIEAERIRDKQYIGWCLLSIFEHINLTYDVDNSLRDR